MAPMCGVPSQPTGPARAARAGARVSIVGTIGAALVVGSATISGYRLHLWLIAHAPNLAMRIPRDSGAIGGFLFGCAAVARWLV